MDGLKTKASKETKVTQTNDKTLQVLEGIKSAMLKAGEIHSKLYGTPQEERAKDPEAVDPPAFFDKLFCDLNEMNSLLNYLTAKLNDINDNL